VKNDKGVVEKVEAKVTVIDGKGGYMIPGIIDSHQHIMLSKNRLNPDFAKRNRPDLAEA